MRKTIVAVSILSLLTFSILGYLFNKINTLEKANNVMFGYLSSKIQKEALNPIQEMEVDILSLKKDVKFLQGRLK